MPDAASQEDRNNKSQSDKVAFLSQPGAYSFPVETVTLRETHMAWVFLTGSRVFKLKKPLRSPFLDFSTVEKREAACRAEFRLNRRLARQTYIDVLPLTATSTGLAIDGSGPAVDWLVVMSQLDERLMLEERLQEKQVQAADLDRLAGVLTRFYRHASPSHLAAIQHIAEWRRGLRHNRHILLMPELRMPGGLVRRIDAVHRDFLGRSETLITARSQARYIVEAHGDLRPEHIWLGEPLQIIDCLEFNQRLRTLDALSEIAFLDLECERLGAAWAGRRLRTRIFSRLPDLEDKALFHFYRSYHAMVRARLAIAHLLEADPRKPQKWRPLALQYLRLADRDVRQLPGFVRRRGGRSDPGSRAAGGRFRQAVGRPGERRFS